MVPNYFICTLIIIMNHIHSRAGNGDMDACNVNSTLVGMSVRQKHPCINAYHESFMYYFCKKTGGFTTMSYLVYEYGGPKNLDLIIGEN